MFDIPNVKVIPKVSTTSKTVSQCCEVVTLTHPDEIWTINSKYIDLKVSSLNRVVQNLQKRLPRVNNQVDNVSFCKPK